MAAKDDKNAVYQMQELKAKDILSRIEDLKNERKELIIAEVNLDTVLKELESSRGLSQKDKMNYAYKVMPYFKDIANMIENSIKMTQIAKILDIPYASLDRMRKEIPALNELFYVSELAVMEQIEANLEAMTRPQVVWEDKIDPTSGTIKRLERIVTPSFPAIKFALETNPHTKQKFQKETVITHKQGVSKELEDILKTFTTEDLKALNANLDNVVEAEFTEHDE